jgi:hypothetical protein
MEATGDYWKLSHPINHHHSPAPLTRRRALPPAWRKSYSRTR